VLRNPESIQVQEPQLASARTLPKRQAHDCDTHHKSSLELSISLPPSIALVPSFGERGKVMRVGKMHTAAQKAIQVLKKLDNDKEIKMGLLKKNRPTYKCSYSSLVEQGAIHLIILTSIPQIHHLAYSSPQPLIPNSSEERLPPQCTRHYSKTDTRL
jgi:hypothetical protein